MFERFTDRARRVVVLAQEESRELGHDHIGTEHFLLALIREEDGIAGKALTEAGLTLDAARKQVEAAIGRGDPEPPKRRSGKRWRRHVPFTSRSKKTMELALREALGLGHDYIGTEHLLLGLIALGEGVGLETLTALGADPGQVREAVLKLAEARPEVARSIREFRQVTDRPMPLREAIAEAVGKPRCPQCQSDLAESAAVRAMVLPVHEGQGTRSVELVFCRECGCSLGVLGG